MATINQYFDFSLLAQSAYENLSGVAYGDNDALKNRLAASGNDSGFTAKQAELFTDGINGFSLRDHNPNGLLTGFSASLFESNANPGEFTLALRGTEPTDPRDLLSDTDLALTGLARDQIISMYRYYKQLITPAGQAVNYSSAELLTLAGIKDFTDTPLATSVSYLVLLAETSFDTGLGKLSPTAKINVVGHSLVGSLAMAFVNLFPNAVAHAYTFNGAGLGGAGIELIDRITGVQSSVASNLVTNLIADPNNDFTAGVGTVLGETKRSFIEKQSLAFSDHSMGLLTDSLALQSLLARIDPSLTLDKLNILLKSASADPANTLELTLDALRTLFQKNYQYGQLEYDAVPTMVGDGATARNAYYVNLQSLQTWWKDSPFTGLSIQPLAEVNGSQIATLALADTAEGMAYRYALYKLNPFVVTGSSALYDGINAHNELKLYSPASNTGHFTEQYLRDRAAMLTWKLGFGTKDTAPVGDTFVKPQGGTPFYFEDFTSNAITTKMRIGGGDSVDAVMSRPLGDFKFVVFGSENGDVLTGQGKDDRLYGGGWINEAFWQEVA